MKKIIVSIILCIVVLITGCSQQESKRAEVAQVGKLAPDFTLVDTKGVTWNLEELKGQVVFINFWATWCPPCRREMPSMQSLYTSLPTEKFKMLAILSNDEPAFGDVVAGKIGTTFPILDDPDNMAARAYGITGVPETFIVDKQGILRQKYIGPINWDSPGIRKMLKKYLAQ